MDLLFNMGWAEILIVSLVVLIILILALPYSYLLVRLVSKAWQRSKNEERSY